MQKNLRNNFIGLGFLLSAILFPQLGLAYQAAPSSITKEPTFVTEKSAKFNGRVVPNDTPDTTQWFEWGISGRSTTYETQHNALWWSGPADTAFDVYGLAPDTQYFYRQISENSRGRDVGNTFYFTTKSLPRTTQGIVIITTLEPTSVTDGSAILHGVVSPHENATTAWWFQWGTTNKFENETPHAGTGGATAQADVPLAGLTSGTIYYYRLVAENSEGRVMGATKVFVTAGTSPQAPETARDQNIPSPQASASDGTARKITTNASAGQFGGGPGTNFLATLFGGKSASTTTSTGTQAAAVGMVGNSNKNIVVAVEKVGPSNAPAHTTVEYRVSYSYRLAQSAKNAKLKITIPSTVVYIGDNTNNELLLEEGGGGERTYILPIGNLANGSTRTISILGMTTGDANGTFPDARARIEYLNGAGETEVVSGGAPEKNAVTATVANASNGGGILPSSLIGWTLYVLLIVGLIIGVSKFKSFYNKRKAEIAAREEELKRPTQG